MLFFQYTDKAQTVSFTIEFLGVYCMARYRCTICNYVYDESKEKTKFTDLPADWVCPVCGAPKTVFVLLTDQAPPEKIERTVSEVLVDQISAWGVQYVFGIPGTSTLGIMDAIRKNGKMKYYQVRHEQTAAFMASAYGKLTGHIAACLAISGPGSTNLATGLYDASLDHSPVLALTGLVERQLIGPGSTQEIDQYSFFNPMTVFNKILMTPNQTTTLSTLAIKYALIDKGVANIGIPNDVQKLPCTEEIQPFEGRIPSFAYGQEDSIIEKAAKIVNQAEKPVIVSGFGAMGQSEKLLKLATKISAPIVTTFKAKGLIDETHELSVGCHGGIGSTAAAELVQNSDLLIVIGSSFSDLTALPNKKTLQIDINPLIIAKKHPVEASLLGNSAVLIPKLTAKVAEKQNPARLKEIKQLKQNWLAQLEKEADPTKTPLRPPYIMKVLTQKIADNAVISLDVGENCWWFGRNFLMKKTQKMVMSGYLATMGFGFPGALAATIAYPERQIICITGDGGLTMVLGDFLTAVKYGLPVKTFVLNNKSLGMIKQEQKVEGYEGWQTDLQDFSFAKYAENAGGIGIKVIEPNQLEVAVDEGLAAKKPVIVEIETDAARFSK